MRPFPDIIGKRYGKLTVVERTGSKRISARSSVSLWRCACDCGGERITPASPLFLGRTTSCGCNRYRERKAKHGHGGNGHKGIKPSSTYTAWRSMVVRCTKQRTAAYNRYGGRGITVCDRWLDSFENFLADMGEKPSSGLSLDRIDGDRGYSPDNCRWATAIVQATNRAVVRKIPYKGKVHSIAALSRLSGHSEEVIRFRLKKGWSPERTIETPVRHKRKSARELADQASSSPSISAR